MRVKDQILCSQMPEERLNLASALQVVAARSGRTTLSHATELLWAVGPKRGFTPAEYFVQGAWMGDPAARAAFLSNRKNILLNDSLMATGRNQRRQIADKYLTGMLLKANGFPVPELRAGFAVDRQFGAVPMLNGAKGLADWISDPANLPVFAKPVDGSNSLGSVPLIASDRPGMVDLGERVVPIAALAEEVERLYPRGWLLQELIVQTPKVEALIGPGVGTVRIVTLWEEGGPALMYGVWRHPPDGARIDENLRGPPSVGCEIEAVTGSVVHAQLGNLYSGKPITQSRIDPDLALIGFQVPGWHQIVALCCQGHRLFPEHAHLGWDIALSQRGPVIFEINSNPAHISYQRAFRKGFMGPDFLRRIETARRLLLQRTPYSAHPMSREYDG